jgi:hypothetical protein
MTAPVVTMIVGYRTRLAACQRLSAHRVVLLVTAATAAFPCSVSAQRIDGSIGVSLTILPPAADQNVRVTDFLIDRDGVAVVRTTAPTDAHHSQVVMTRVTSSADGLVPARYVPALPCAARATECSGRERRYRVDVGRSADGAAPRDVRVRIEYLVVPGT